MYNNYIQKVFTPFLSEYDKLNNKDFEERYRKCLDELNGLKPKCKGSDDLINQRIYSLKARLTLVSEWYYDEKTLSEDVKERKKVLEEKMREIKKMKEDNKSLDDQLRRSKEMMELIRIAGNREVKVVQDGGGGCIIIQIYYFINHY